MNVTPDREAPIIPYATAHQGDFLLPRKNAELPASFPVMALMANNKIVYAIKTEKISVSLMESSLWKGLFLWRKNTVSDNTAPMDTIPSKLVEITVNEFSNLPGIGRKTAMRLALHLLKQPEHQASALGKAIIQMVESVSYCPDCHSLSDGGPCTFCSNPKRKSELVCVVEDLPDQLAIEKTSQYQGLYHVLGGVISPMEGRGPSDLNITSLISRIKENAVKEVILALPSTIEGDTTAFYLFKQLKDTGVLVTTIARGVPVGDELEYADEVTLGRSILNRSPYEKSNS